MRTSCARSLGQLIPALQEDACPAARRQGIVAQFTVGELVASERIHQGDIQSACAQSYRLYGSAHFVQKHLDIRRAGSESLQDLWNNGKTGRALANRERTSLLRLERLSARIVVPVRTGEGSGQLPL